MGFETRINQRHSLFFAWDPFESRDFGAFDEPVSFGGVVFPADSTIRSAYRLYDIRARWTYSFTPDGPWIANAGLGLMYQYVTLKLETEDKSQSARADDDAVLPYVHATLGYRFANRFEGILDMEGLSRSSDWMVDTVVMLNCRMGYQWTASAGYRYHGRKIRTSDRSFRDKSPCLI